MMLSLRLQFDRPLAFAEAQDLQRSRRCGHWRYRYVPCPLPQHWAPGLFLPWHEEHVGHLASETGKGQWTI